MKYSPIRSYPLSPYTARCLPTPHARAVSDDKYTCDIVSTHTRTETSTLSTQSKTPPPPPSHTLLHSPHFMYSYICTRSGMNIYVLAPVTISPDSLWSMICYQSISPSMHVHIDISIEHVEPHAMRYAHVLVITQINLPVCILDTTWTISLLGGIAIGIHWNDAFLLVLVSQTHKHIKLAVKPAHPIFLSSLISFYILVYTHNLTPFRSLALHRTRGGTTLTPSFPSRWRCSLARSSADSRPTQVFCGHGRHQ